MLLSLSQSSARLYLQQLRWHHWPKNLLVFVPAIAAQRLYEPGVLMLALIGFAGMCAAASSIYLINDLIDLRHDRMHPVKRDRPLASGRLPIPQALALLPLLWGAVAVASIALSAAYAVVVVAYLALMVVYSVWLKRLRFVDAFALGAGYVCRLAAGAAAAGIVLAPTLAVWCLLMFASLAVLKRYAELAAHAQDGVADPGRSYHTQDLRLLERTGRLLGAVSLVPLALHPLLDRADHAWAAWAICLLLGVWMRWIWQAAVAARIDGDPVSFVLRDRASRHVGTIVASLLLILGAPAASAAQAGADDGAHPVSGIMRLQPYRQVERVQLADGPDAGATLQLVHLNPAANVWFVLSVQHARGAQSDYHLENPDPAQAVALGVGGALVLSIGDRRSVCMTGSPRAGSVLDQARRTGLPYAPVCEGRLYLRNAVRGSRTTLEATTQFLRDYVWRGEQIVGFV
ncbi:MAG TPA: UbiA family prenyltransferase, partial [Burkholderiaceae bacterium]|nr:UbiA family prenyltransferase [Burkholderiaceae bacterium]